MKTKSNSEKSLKITLEVEVNSDWADYVNGSIHPDLVAEDLFPPEVRKDGIIAVKVITTESE